MYNTKLITDDTYYVGSSDRRLALFENIYPIERGVSYNSYVVTDEKTVLLDTVDHSVSRQFIENLEHVLGGRKLDYVIINHVEPDHLATLDLVVRLYPDVKIVGNAKTIQMIKQFFTFNADENAFLVKEGDSISTGKHTFTFVFAPMVHWPEVMVTYDSFTKTLFSADAFGTFGALSGNLFADEYDFDREWLDDARRYYINIVGKYGMMVQNVLKKAATLDIAMICPLHGPIWRKDLSYFISKYDIWSKYDAEDDGVVIVYSSIYGNTENACAVLSSMLADLGVRNIRMYDASKTDSSYLVSELFRYSKAVFASSTYNAEIFPKMESLLLDLKAHLYQKKKVALIENGSWAISSGKKMSEILCQMKDVEIVAPVLTLKSSLKEDQLDALMSLAKSLV